MVVLLQELLFCCATYLLLLLYFYLLYIKHAMTATKQPNKINFQTRVDSTFHPSEVGEMSSRIINAAQVCRGCADRQRSPRLNSFGKSSSAHTRGRYVPQSRATMLISNDTLRCCNVKLCVSLKFQPYVKKNNHKITKPNTLNFQFLIEVLIFGIRF